MNNSSSNSQDNTSLWESPALIPVLLMIVKEQLEQWEKQPEPELPAIDRYLTLCEHWQHSSINERQKEWLQEIESYLNLIHARSYQQSRSVQGIA